MQSVPNIHPFVVVLSLALVGFMMAFFMSWGLVLFQVANRQLVIPKPELRTVAPWGLLDIVVAMLLMLSLQFMAVNMAVRWDWISKEELQSLQLISPDNLQEESLQLSPISMASSPNSQEGQLRFSAFIQSLNLIVMIVATIWIAVRCHIPISRIGWSIKRPANDFVLAIGMAFLFLPFIYFLMFAVSYGLETPYQHPILKMVGENLWLISIAIWMAVGVAPITEEFLFRVLLQGYLESMAAGPITIKDVLLGRMDSPRWITGSAPSSSTPLNDVAPQYRSEEFLVPTTQTPASSNPYIPPPRRGLTDPVRLGSSDSTPLQNGSTLSTDAAIVQDGVNATIESTRVGRMPWWPVITSSVLFGLAHFEYGLSWIPLIFLGLMLGWLYRTTHRIWPCLMLHVLVNSIAMAGLAAQILSGVKP